MSLSRRRRRPGHRAGRRSRGSARYRERPRLGTVVVRQFVIDGRRLNATRGLVEAAAHERAFLARVLGGARMVVIRSKQDLANIEMNGEGVECLA